MDYDSPAIIFGSTIHGFSSASSNDLHITSETIFKVSKVVLIVTKPYTDNISYKY